MDAEVWRQAKGVLAEALLCPAHERAAFVNARCPDLSLRREVQAYLTQYDESFLESVLTVSDTIDSTSSAAAGDEGRERLDINIGDRIGPYVVLDRLGIGGMGHVFLGNDTRLQRKVALKCLIASASAAELRARILHEARAAARITHPNIAIVHDVVEHDSRPFLAMEYVEGENLAVVIKRDKPPLDTILTMTRQLASALSAAHAKGIVHRDLKPANIQVTPDGSVKILDFGVAHAMSALATGTTTPGAALTVHISTSTLQGDRVAMHPGTPAYMSPEQMFGRAIDQRSDIYSLGVIVYEMATGHRPYAVDDPLELVLTLSRNFLRPGDAETPLPAQVSEVVAKMLAVRPEERYQTAGDLEAAIVALTAVPQQAVVAAPAASRVRAAGRMAVVVAVAFAVTTVLGCIESFGFNRTLGRVAPFDQDSLATWVEMGLRALVNPLVYTIAAFVVLAAVRFFVRLLSLSRGIEHLLTTGATHTARFSAHLGLSDPLVLGQAVAGIGLVALVAAVWLFSPFISAFGSASISDFAAQKYSTLQPANTTRHFYRVVFTLLTVGLSLAAVRIQRVRATQVVHKGGGGLAIVSAMIVVSLVMCQLPYRIVWKNEMPRLDLAGERCYEIGATADELLLHCPDRQPPRNRIVKRNDPAVHDTGIRQNIFTPPETSHE